MRVLFRRVGGDRRGRGGSTRISGRDGQRRQRAGDLLVAASGTYDFGSVAAGTTAAATPTFKLTNTGGSATADADGHRDRARSPCRSDACTGTSLGPRKSCTVQVTYTASSPGGGTDTGTLTAKGVKPNTTATENLQGESQTPASVTFGNFDTVDPGAGGPGVDSWLVSVAGFSPNTAITFTATGTDLEQDYFPASFDTTDSSGNISGGNAGFVGAYCEGQQVTVTATDGVHTASATENLPASC